MHYRSIYYITGKLLHYGSIIILLVVTNVFDAIKKGKVPLQTEHVRLSEEMRNVRGCTLEEMEFRPMRGQPSTQYMGSSGDRIYRGIG